MLSIGKLVAGAEDYYLRTVAQGQEEYYTGAGEAPGRWAGAGARRLGLSGTVEPACLRAVLAGRDPLTGADLTAGRTGRGSRVAGFDCTLSAPKSVSVLWALSGAGPDGVLTGSTADTVRRAHDRAVDAAITYLETHAHRARRGAGGESRISTTGMVAAAFRHRTSRSGDPQLHTHVLVANVCQGTDGRWSAPDARLLYYHGRTAGFVYQAALRAELADSLGLRFGPVHRGVAEVEGIPKILVREFSTRRAEIEAALERHGVSGARAAEIAALDTRRAKSGSVEADRSLHDSWRDRARALGVDPVSVQQLVGGPRALQLNQGEGASLAVALLSPTGLTEQVSVFERRDVVRAVAERLPDGAPLTTVERLADEILDAPGVVPLPGDGPGGEGRRTTAELLATEARVLKSADSRRHDGAGLVSRVRLDEALAASPSLSAEQRFMVERLTTSGAGVEVVVGKAGAGKTTALAAARRAWENAGLEVIGTALSARAAAGLQDGAGIPSVTVARLSSEGRNALGDRSVLVVDEAGMVGTRDLDRLLAAAGEAGSKVVLVGDPRQLPEIASGGAFGSLAQRLGALKLAENRRQVEDWERAGLDELRHGDVVRGLASYDRRDRVHAAPTLAGARERLVADWLEARGAGEVRMLAPTRSEVDQLNALARQALHRRGLLGSIVADAGGSEFALGDHVMCLRNDRRLGVMNGTRGTVVAPTEGGGLTILAGGELLHLPTPYLESGHLAHGYATTIHKSQGETVDRAFVLGGAGLFREAGYVALSRARTRTDLYHADGAFEDGRGPDIEPLAGLTRSFATSRAKTLAHAAEGDAQLDLIRRVLSTSPEPDDSRSDEPEGRGRERQFSAPDLGLER